MKRFLQSIGVIGTIIMVLWDVAEFLAIPAVFVTIGLLNSFSWRYYVITIGGYLVLSVVLEIIAYFIYKALDKKYTPIIERKLEKYFDKKKDD